MRNLIYILLPLLLISCKPCQLIVETVEKEKIVEVHTRDTAIITAADSAGVRALLRCDSAYNVILDELVTMQGDRIEAEVHMSNLPGGLLLTMDCKEDSLENVIQLRDSIIREMEKNTKVVMVRERNGYDKFTSAGFWVLLVLCIGAIIARILVRVYLKK